MLLAVSIAIMSTLLASALTTQFVFTNTPEAQRGVDLIEEMRGVPISTNEVVIVRSETMTIDDPAFEQAVTGYHPPGNPGGLPSHWPSVPSS